MHPGDCVVATVHLPGDLSEGVNYVVGLTTRQGLAFNRSCTDSSETWQVSGRPGSQTRGYPVYDCSGHTRGVLEATLEWGSTAVSATRATVTVRPRPTTPTSTPGPTPVLPAPITCPGSQTGTQPRVPSNRITIIGLSSVMEEGGCDEVTISVPGDVLEDVDYTVTLSTNRGLYFDSSCSGASNQIRDWHLSGRTWYAKIYAVWACAGHTAGSLNVAMQRDDAAAGALPLSMAGDWTRIVTPAPAPTSTPTPTPTPTPEPTPTRTPGPTPTPSILCAHLGRGGDAGDRAPVPGFVIRTDAAMNLGDCVEARVMVPNLGWDVGYRVEMTAAYGLSFNRQCTSQSRPGVDRPGQGPHTLPVAIVACDDPRGYGILTAEIVQGGVTLDTASTHVLVIKDTSLMDTIHGSWNNGKNVCFITEKLNRKDDHTHFRNGLGKEAYHVRSTIYGGRTVTSGVLEFLKYGMDLGLGPVHTNAAHRR